MTFKAVSKAEAKWRIEQMILLDPTVRTGCLTIFAEAIQEAARHHPDRWAVTVEDELNLIRLIAGHTIICTLCLYRPVYMEGCIWMALDGNLLEKSEKTRELLDASDDWRWSPKKERYHIYKEIKSQNGYFRPQGDYSLPWKQIAPLHFESIHKAQDSRKMDPKTPLHHQSGVIQYLHETLGQNLPDVR